MAVSPDDLDDIQGLLKSGYGPLGEAAYLLLRIRDPGAARAWLRAFRPTTVGDLNQKVARARHVAFTASGLAALGLPAAVLEGFSPEFVGGMADDPARSRRLGDVGANAPAGWAWGRDADEPHLLVMLFAAGDDLAALKSEVQNADFATAFDVRELSTAPLDGREPFGFVDGLSQPEIDWAGERTPGTSEDLDYGNLIAAGEFVLGHPNEYGLVTRTPGTRADGRDGSLGRNGSYLVFRQLAQDVEGFWTFVNARGGLPLAEAMVGRRRDGQALAEPARRTIRGVGPKQADITFNNYDFESDVDGTTCPVSGHVRRANPRTGDQPGGDLGPIRKLAGMLGVGLERRADTVASSRFHRLLRRGRKYVSSEGTGLHFITLGASIARQFEFVQGAWLASAKFGGLSGEQDPLLGSRQPFPEGHATDGFRWPQKDGPCAAFEGLPQFVTVRGGAYFFLPGLAALRRLAEL